MEPRYMDYPSPRGVHVPETYANHVDSDAHRHDSAYSPYRNRYSRSVHQTPRVRDVTWISSPDPTPQAFHAPSALRSPSPQVPPSSPRRPSSVVPPSPAPTVGEYMTVDDVVFTQGDTMDPYTYQPLFQRQSRGVGLFKSFWKGLRKLSGIQSTPYIPKISSYESQTVEVPAPGLSAPSEATQYGNPTFLGTGEQHGATPHSSPYLRSTNLVATPAVIPSSLRRSPVPMPSAEIPPPITIASPSITRSPLPNSIRSIRMTSPAMGATQNLPVRGPEPVVPLAEDGSQTLHEPVLDPGRPLLPSALARPVDAPKFPAPGRVLAFDLPSISNGSLSSTMIRFRRFIAELDGLPWVSDAQIADEYIPERNPRSRMRRKVRQGAEPSWYNPRPEMVERPEYWSEWDMWAKQSAAALWDGVHGDGHAIGWGGAGGPGQQGVMYPHGYVPAQPGFVYPSGYPPPGIVNNQVYAPVLP